MEGDSFVIVDVRNTMLHLVRTDMPLVVSLNETDIDAAIVTLDLQPPALQGTQKLVWAAFVLASGVPPDSETLDRLSGRADALREDDAYITLRYGGETSPLTLILRRKTG